jgi:hypothetical protein
MKKRLLSAALALAMVLTMLPLSVFAAASTPAAAGDGTERVNYVEYNDANDNYPDAPAWYVTHVTPASTSGGVTTPAKTEYIKVENGVSVGGYYYSSTNIDATPTVTGGKITENKSIYNYSVGSSGNAVKTGLKGAVTVIGGTISIDAVNNSSLTVDICGGTVTIMQTNTGSSTTKLTSLTINNSLYAKTKEKGSLTMTSLDKLTSLTLNNVKVTAEIKMESKVVSTNATQNDGGQAHSITLNGAETAAILLNGVGTNSPATRAAQTVNITNSSVGDITVKGVNNNVTLNEVKATTAPAVTIEGTGGNLNVRGGSTLGAVTVTSGADKETTAAPSNITVETGSTVASITSAQTDDKATGRNTITINGTVTNAVTAKNSAVNVSGGHTGNIALTTGTVSVSGNRASVGDVELTKDATFNLTGSNCTVGELKVASGGTPATVTFNVPNDPSNTLGGTSNAISGGYTKKTIKGGTWTNPVSAANLDTSLAYQLKKGNTGSTYTYYTSDQLGEAIIKQGGSTSDNTLTKIGDTAATTKVTFMNGSMEWGVLTINANVVIPKLPTQMNNIKTPYWSDGQFSNLTGSYSVPKDGATLNAGGGVVSTDVTKLTKVTVNNTDSDIKAILSGNTIVLSGAVKSGDTKFDLELETDAVTVDNTGPNNPKEVPVVIKVSVIFDPSTKTLTIANPGSQSLGHGVIIENTFQAIKLSNGSRYTFDGKGLVVRNTTIKVKGVDTDKYPDVGSGTGMHEIEVIVSAPGYTSTQALKDQIINLIRSNGAAIDWSKSPAVKRAVNAALATISDSTVEGYINAASARARSDWKLGSKDATAYQNNPQVWLVPYLEVNVSNYLPNAVNPSITATLTLKWRVEVHPTDTSTSAKDYIVKEAANVANKAGTFIAKQGAALSLDSDLGDKGVKITFAGLTSHTFAHQADTYDYEISNGAFTVTHAINGNLGKFVLDTVKPMIELGTKASNNNAMGTVDGYFSTLQAAVDAAEDGEMIEINSNYKGSTTINMTGKARTIYIQANGKNVVVANASGGLVEDNSKGSFYTIKLNRDNSVVSTNVTIAVNTATGGSASVSSGSAKPGDTVTVTPRASNGYKVSGVTAVTNTGASVPVKANSNGTYTFTVPANATKVTVTPRFVASENRIFPDVDPKSWYGPSVKYCYETTVRGVRLMEGDANGNFAPNAKLTRAQMVQMLYNLAGRPTVTGACPFPDVVGTGYDWAAAPITWAAQKGYVIGYSDGKFHPEVNISRQDMVLILYRYAKQPAIGASGSLSGYYDASSVGSWAYDAVRWAASMGILSGTNSVALNGYINGPVRANRCEVAVTLANFHRLYG